MTNALPWLCGSISLGSPDLPKHLQSTSKPAVHCVAENELLAEAYTGEHLTWARKPGPQPMALTTRWSQATTFLSKCCLLLPGLCGLLYASVPAPAHVLLSPFSCAGASVCMSWC